ncbi:hypothetical protein [Mobiluncus mulieris]|uniref:Uncharacterized protein n=1 Tax=Mobiluncus mulieris TaxID=2052 RepID=A0A7Y0URV6_9ACTO|nr:hypothetical protein [Mobiluncus mulieris]NMX02394.1 hypothetical protein [Mobiluncus mulieris]
MGVKSVCTFIISGVLLLSSGGLAYASPEIDLVSEQVSIHGVDYLCTYRPGAESMSVTVKNLTTGKTDAVNMVLSYI